MQSELKVGHFLPTQSDPRTLWPTQSDPLTIMLARLDMPNFLKQGSFFVTDPTHGLSGRPNPTHHDHHSGHGPDPPYLPKTRNWCPTRGLFRPSSNSWMQWSPNTVHVWRQWAKVPSSKPSVNNWLQTLNWPTWRHWCRHLCAIQ